MTQQAKQNKSGGIKAALPVLAAAAISAVLFYYLAKNTTLADWAAMFRGLQYQYLLIYFALFLFSMYLKAARYQVLLKASNPAAYPRVGDLMLVSLASNLFVDLLPARSGSLAYVVIANRRLKVELKACFSSLAFAFIFDIIALVPVFALAILVHGLTKGQGHQMLWAVLGLLGVVGLAALFLMEKALDLAAWVLGRLAHGGHGGLRRLLARVGEEAQKIAGDVVKVKQSGVYGRVLLLSVLVRLAKYLGLYVLVLGLAGRWGQEVASALSLPLTLFALVASEATAALPISGIAGFGAYEGVFMAVLRQAGLTAKAAAMIPFGLHMITQTIDYTLGGLCLVYITLIKKRDAAQAEDTEENRG